MPQSISHPASRVSQPVSQSGSQPVFQPAYQPGSESESHPVSQPVLEPACPSVEHALARVDGGLVRIRRPGGRIDADGLEAVALAASRWGSGVVEITNRANLQLRGIRTAGAAEVAEALSRAGLSAGPAGDRRRNVLLDPMGGLAGGAADFGPILGPLLAALDADPRLDDLDDKFGFAVDGGGRWGLSGRRAAVVVTAGEAPGAATVRCGWKDPAEPPAIVDMVDLPSALTAAAVDSLGRRRGSVEVPGGSRPVCGPLGIGPTGSGWADPGRTGPGSPVAGSSAAGSSAAGSSVAGGPWVGTMPVLGRIQAAQLAALADSARRHSAGAVRLTPWRGLVFPGVDRPAELLAELAGLGLVTDPADPAATVVACAGSGGCTSALVDAVGDAQTLIEARRRMTGTPAPAPPVEIHVSGCPKSCAQRAPAAVALIASQAGRYDLYRGGRLERERLDTPDALASALRAGS